MATRTAGFLLALRERAGLTQPELAAKLGTTHATVGKLERGERSFGWKWARKYTEVFSIDEESLMAQVRPQSPARTEIAAATFEGAPEFAQHAFDLAGLGLRLYRVLHSRVTDLGLVDGQLITVDERPESLSTPPALAVVVVRLGEALLLRQWIPPATFITCQAGAPNRITRTDDGSGATIVGIVTIRPVGGSDPGVRPGGHP